MTDCWQCSRCSWVNNASDPNCKACRVPAPPGTAGVQRGAPPAYRPTSNNTVNQPYTVTAQAVATPPYNPSAPRAYAPTSYSVQATPYTPAAPKPYTPTSSAYTPTPSAYTPTPSAYTPTPSAYTLTPSAYTPTPSAYTPTPSAYTPTPSAYTPSSSYTPSAYTTTSSPYTPAAPGPSNGSTFWVCSSCRWVNDLGDSGCKSCGRSASAPAVVAPPPPKPSVVVSGNPPPKKFTKIDGVTKVNPEYKTWQESQGGGSGVTVTATVVAPNSAIPIVTAVESSSYKPNNQYAPYPATTSTTYATTPAAPPPRAPAAPAVPQRQEDNGFVSGFKNHVPGRNDAPTGSYRR